jgi:peptidoglycan/LPS O-acetylase OafA/YrhL
MPLDNNDPSTVSSTWEPLKIFVTVFVLGGLAGLAALLRSKEELTRKAICGAIINSAFCSLIVALVWWNKYQETNFFFLMGVSILAGFGGNTTIGILIAAFQKGLKITIADPNDESDRKK